MFGHALLQDAKQPPSYRRDAVFDRALQNADLRSDGFHPSESLFLVQQAGGAPQQCMPARQVPPPRMIQSHAFTVTFLHEDIVLSPMAGLMKQRPFTVLETIMDDGFL
jgi:hypothetical protein